MEHEIDPHREEREAAIRAATSEARRELHEAAEAEAEALRLMRSQTGEDAAARALATDAYQAARAATEAAAVSYVSGWQLETMGEAGGVVSLPAPSPAAGTYGSGVYGAP